MVRLQRHCAAADRVLLLYPAGIEFTVAFFACSYAGVIAVPAPKPGRYQYERRRLAGIARDSGARVVLADRVSLPIIEKWLVDEGLADVVCHATDDPSALGEPDRWVSPSVSPDAPALLQYTSGSTGQPKGVVVSHGNLLSNVDGLAALLGVEGLRTGGLIPLYHDMGLIGVMLLGVLRGAGCVQMDPMTFLRRPHLWLRMLDEQDVAMTAAPNFGYDLCARRVTDEQLAGLDLSRVRIACNGSEPVHPATVDGFCSRFAAAGFRSEAMVQVYGLAENTLIASGTVGRPPLRRRFDAAALEQRELRPAGPDQAA
jgi:acyl-CoA synthetase (AMP-forming)/AMP-acid ligase II